MGGRIVYEVNLRVDPEIAAEFDDWLRGHVDRMLALPGFVDARIVVPDTDDPDAALRTTLYSLSDRAALDHYLNEHAEAMRAEGLERFGERFSATRRVLEDPSSAGVVVYCSNCGDVLAGQYCSACGQRAATRLISLWQLVTDALGDLLNVDSRFWRTVRSLLLRPGQLTLEYLRGRRMRYMPPFRTYLVLSLAVFLLYGPGLDETTLRIGEADGSTGAAATDAAATPDDPPVAGEPPLAANGNDSAIEVRFDEDDGGCPGFVDGLPATLKRFLDTDRAVAACEAAVADGGRPIAREFVERLPATLIVMLPLLALLLKLLYPLSRRYYVEHLLFVVHFQAFVFLAILITQIVGGPLLLLPPPANTAGPVLAGTLALYAPFYLFVSMRRVYGQGRLLTLVKYVALLLGYLVGAALLGGIVITASLLGI